MTRARSNPTYAYTTPAPPFARPGWSSLIPGITLVLGLYLIASAIMFSPEQSQGRAASDQFSYHEPTIRKMATDLPSPDLVDYWSATTPGYHLLLSLPVRAFDPSREALMLGAAGFTAGLYLLLSTWLARRVGPGRALWLALPLLASVYTLFPGVWLLPDNAGWLLVASIYLLALRQRFDRWTLLAGGVCLLALVWVRQSHLWAAGMLLAAAWLGTASAPTGPAAHAHALPDDPPARPFSQFATLFQTRLWGRNSVASRIALTALAILPAVLSVAWFARLWGGLTPPRFQEQYGDASGGIEPATPAFFLSVVGLFIPFMWGYVWPGFRRLCKTPALPIAITLGALALALVPETFPASPGRRSGIWHLAGAAPILLGHTSLVIALLAPLGALGLASLLATVPRRTAWVTLAGLAGFVLAQTVSPMAWQRYHEPLVLIVLAVLCAEVAAHRPFPGFLIRFLRVAGPLTLALFLALVTLMSLRREDPITPQANGDMSWSIEAQPIRDWTPPSPPPQSQPSEPPPEITEPTNPAPPVP